jgi:ferrochelatase
MGSEGHTAVVLLNLGGPDSLAAVRPFLYNLFSDRLIIRLGPSFMQKPLAWWIARKRAPISRGYYQQIGGASPLGVITEGQAAALETRLREHGEFRTYTGMRYWSPSIESAVDKAINAGANRVLALSLYPQYSIATTGSSEQVFNCAISGRLPKENVSAVPPWYDNHFYLESMGDVIRKAIEQSAGNSPHILFSAHSLPKSFIDDGDPYADQIMATIKALMERFNNPWSIGYQSRSGPVQWLGPSTEKAIAELARDGVKDVVCVPISFVSDHIETLYEIDILYKGLARQAGIDLIRTESLNVHPIFIRALESLVLTTVKKEGWL